MKLDNVTIEILKNFASINPSLMVKQGNFQKTVSLTDSVIAKATLGQSFEKDFAIYDLSNFISALQMFDGAELTFEEQFVKLSNKDSTASIKYYYADPSVLIKSRLLEKEVKHLTSNIKFRLTKDMLNEALKAVSILSLPEIRVKGDGEHIAVEAVNPKNITSNLYRKVITASEVLFEAYFKVDNLKLIANDYDIIVAPPAQSKGVGIANFVSPSVSYWIATEAHSSF